MEQPQYNLFERDRVERDLKRLYSTIGLGLTTWSPLASGLLSGKYNDGVPPGSRLSLKNLEWLKDELLTPERLDKARELAALAREHSCTLAQLSLAWCLRNPDVSSVITGASRPEQVTENMKAADVAARLTPDVMARIDEILANRPVVETY